MTRTALERLRSLSRVTEASFRRGNELALKAWEDGDRDRGERILVLTWLAFTKRLARLCLLAKEGGVRSKGSDSITNAMYGMAARWERVRPSLYSHRFSRHPGVSAGRTTASHETPAKL